MLLPSCVLRASCIDSAAGSAGRAMATATPTIASGASSTRDQPRRNARSDSDEEGIGLHQVLQPEEPARGPLARGLARLWRHRAAVVGPIDVEQQHPIGVDFR